MKRWKEKCPRCGKVHIFQMGKCPSCHVYCVPEPASERVNERCPPLICDGCEAYRGHQS
jgi:late competence protein required for DNA uptake (superfamily II DNA/RNA helicase)